VKPDSQFETYKEWGERFEVLLEDAIGDEWVDIKPSGRGRLYEQDGPTDKTPDLYLPDLRRYVECKYKKNPAYFDWINIVDHKAYLRHAYDEYREREYIVAAYTGDLMGLQTNALTFFTVPDIHDIKDAFEAHDGNWVMRFRDQPEVESYGWDTFIERCLHAGL